MRRTASRGKNHPNWGSVTTVNSGLPWSRRGPSGTQPPRSWVLSSPVGALSPRRQSAPGGGSPVWTQGQSQRGQQPLHSHDGLPWLHFLSCPWSCGGLISTGRASAGRVHLAFLGSRVPSGTSPLSADSAVSTNPGMPGLSRSTHGDCPLWPETPAPPEPEEAAVQASGVRLSLRGTPSSSGILQFLQGSTRCP